MNVFLTGGTGFLGQYLLAELLERGHSVCALYRDESKKEDTSRFLSEVSVGAYSEHLHWIKGDILEADSLWDEWRRNHSCLRSVENILHSAASLRFFENESGEPFRTNVEGAKALARVAARTQLKTHIVSTAYVCGLITGGVVYERNHPAGRFVNDYEKSKWEAEQIWAGNATILRPGIVVGHSITGRSSSFTGWYKIVKVLHLLDRSLVNTSDAGRFDLQISVPSDPLATANIVPVDYVAKASIEIIEDPNNHNKIFHLTHPNPPTLEWSLHLMCEKFRLGGITFSGQESQIGVPRDELQWMVYKQTQSMLSYFANNPTFDRSNTDEAVPNLKVPGITESLVHRLIDYAVDKNWGKPV